MKQYAVWGNPIAQSKSPLIHQLFAQQTDRQLTYVAKLGDIEQFEQQLIEFFQSGASGANITAPFKERAFTLADEHSDVALQAEACNTLKRLPDGRLFGDNTDGVGLLADLQRLGWIKPNQKILILGAGGATKGVLLPLLQAEQQITIYNRTFDKAVLLAERFAKFGQIEPACWEQIITQSFDIIINATSLGLQGQYVALPQAMLKQSRVYDMQYAPNMMTPFLQYAVEQGAIFYQDGLGMLVYQAAYAFKLWEGVMPDVLPVLTQLKT